MRKFNLEILLGFILIPLLSLKTVGQTDSLVHKNCASIQVAAGVGIPFTPPAYPYTNYFSFSSNGYNINLSGCIPIKHSSIGIEAIISSGGNKIYTASYGWCQSFSASNGGDYGVNSFLLGPVFSIPFHHNKGAVFFRLLGGILYFINPDLTYSGEQPTSYGFSGNAPAFSDPGTWVVTNQNTLSFAMDLGAGIKYNLFKRIFGSLNFDTYNSNADGGNTTTQLTNETTGVTTTSKVSNGLFGVSLYNITIGVGYRIGK